MSRLERPVCVDCRVEMSCARNGFVIRNAEGNRLWRTDKYTCDSCGSSVAVGSSVSQEPTPWDLNAPGIVLDGGTDAAPRYGAGSGCSCPGCEKSEKWCARRCSRGS